MKATIIENDGYRCLVEINDINSPDGYTQIKFITEWDDDCCDDITQKKFELFLNKSQRANLKDLL